MGNMCNSDSSHPNDRNGKSAFDNNSTRRTEDGRRSLLKVKPEVKTRVRIAECDVDLCLGDICEEETMCIIHPTDDNDQSSSEFTKYILSKAGPNVRKEIQEYKNRNKFKLRSGSIFMTSGGNLKAKNLVHLITPRYLNGEMEEERHLEQAIYSALKFIDQAKLTSFSSPVIGVTNGKYPLKTSVHLSFKTLHHYFGRHREANIKVIRIVANEEKIVDSFVIQLANCLWGVIGQQIQELAQEAWNVSSYDDLRESEVGNYSIIPERAEDPKEKEVKKTEAAEEQSAEDGRGETIEEGTQKALDEIPREEIRADVGIIETGLSGKIEIEVNFERKEEKIDQREHENERVQNEEVNVETRKEKVEIDLGFGVRIERSLEEREEVQRIGGGVMEEGDNRSEKEIEEEKRNIEEKERKDIKERETGQNNGAEMDKNGGEMDINEEIKMKESQEVQVVFDLGFGGRKKTIEMSEEEKRLEAEAEREAKARFEEAERKRRNLKMGERGGRPMKGPKIEEASKQSDTRTTFGFNNTQKAGASLNPRKTEEKPKESHKIFAGMASINHQGTLVFISSHFFQLFAFFL